MASDATPGRADPLAALDDLGDFQPTQKPKPRPVPELVREVSEAAGFPSRAATAKPKAVEPPPPAPIPTSRAQRRMRTGRNVQVNMKMTAATAERLNRITDAQGWVYGQTLEHALDALEAALAVK